MQIACLLAARVVGGELHRAHAGATLAFHLTSAAHMDGLETFGQRFLLGRHPAGDGSHGAETAPGAGSIDEGQCHAHDGCDKDDGPEHAANVAPTLGETQLDAEHGEDEEHHEQSESKRAHELWYGPVGRVFREQTVVHASSRTDIAAPVASPPDGGQHRADHADDGYEAYHRIEPSYDKIGKENPIERHTLGIIMTVKVFLLFLLLFHVVFLFSCLWLQSYMENDR